MTEQRVFPVNKCEEIRSSEPLVDIKVEIDESGLEPIRLKEQVNLSY